MKHHLRALLAAVACSVLAAPVAAGGRPHEDSFESAWREAVEERLSLSIVPTRGGHGAEWLHGPVSFGGAFEKLNERPHFRWNHEDFDTWRDDWRESFDRWGRGHGRSWQEPFCLPAVPEPSGVALLAGGLLGLAVLRRRRRR